MIIAAICFRHLAKNPRLVCVEYGIPQVRLAQLGRRSRHAPGRRGVVLVLVPAQDPNKERPGSPVLWCVCVPAPGPNQARGPSSRSRCEAARSLSVLVPMSSWPQRHVRTVGPAVPYWDVVLVTTPIPSNTIPMISTLDTD